MKCRSMVRGVVGQSGVCRFYTCGRSCVAMSSPSTLVGGLVGGFAPKSGLSNAVDSLANAGEAVLRQSDVDA